MTATEKDFQILASQRIHTMQLQHQNRKKEKSDLKWCYYQRTIFALQFYITATTGGTI